MEKEIWKDIIGYEGLYQISNFGQLKSLSRKSNGEFGKIRKPENNGRGYLSISLSKNSKSKHFYIHRLVAKAFISNPQDKPEVNHKQGIKFDNIAIGLEWVTKKENIEHAVKIGLYKIGNREGENNNNAKLTDVKAKKIYYYSQLHSVKETYEKFNTTKNTVNQIKHKRTWKHLWVKQK